jgi:hypothetical protein
VDESFHWQEEKEGGAGEEVGRVKEKKERMEKELLEEITVTGLVHHAPL